MTNSIALIAACLVMVILTFIVSLRMLNSRVAEMKTKRIHPQATATSGQMAAKMEDTRAADNFRNLFEVPVLFYALVAIALAIKHTPDWLAWGAWCFVALRLLHSYIHCTYNKVMQRFYAFMSGFLLLVVLWIAFFVTLPR